MGHTMTELPDTVLLGSGVRIYAPVVACRPVDPSQYSPLLRLAWDKATAVLGREPEVHPGSVRDVCVLCTLEVWIGPHQHFQLTMLDELGLRRIIACFVCAPLIHAQMMAERGT